METIWMRAAWSRGCLRMWSRSWTSQMMWIYCVILLRRPTKLGAQETEVTINLSLFSDRVNELEKIETVFFSRSPTLTYLFAHLSQGECYELVLHESRQLSWRPNSTRALVILGDDLPHEPTYSYNYLRLDWKIEAAALAAEGVKIYGAYCSNDPQFSL